MPPDAVSGKYAAAQVDLFREEIVFLAVEFEVMIVADLEEIADSVEESWNGIAA